MNKNTPQIDPEYVKGFLSKLQVPEKDRQRWLNGSWDMEEPEKPKIIMSNNPAGPGNHWVRDMFEGGGA